MRVQRVIMTDGMESWTVVDDQYTVIEPVDRFLAYMTDIGRSPGTTRSYAFDLRDYFQFLDAHDFDWRTMTLERLSWFVGWLRLAPGSRSAAVTALADTDGGCAPVTINRKLAAVGSFYRFHHRHGVDVGALLTTLSPSGGRGAWRPFLAHLGADQRRRTIKLKTPQQIPRTLTDEQVTQISDACERTRDRFFIELLAGSGLRAGEALGLRHEDIDAAKTAVRVRSRLNSNGARVKSGERIVPVSPGLIRLYTDYLVNEYCDLDSDHVFVNLWGGQRGIAWRYWNLTDLIERLRTRTGIAFTCHMFRHTYATTLLQKKVPAEIVQKLLGHASVTTTTTSYAHLQAEDLRRALADAGILDAMQSGGRP